MNNMTRKLIAEFVGTFLLVFLAVGAAVFGIAAKVGTDGNGPGNGVVGVALAFGLVLLGIAYAFGPVSGAHVNPAVTLAILLGRRMPASEAVAYWVVQCIAAIAGALLARWMWGPEGNLAATRPPEGLAWQAVGFEALLTFGLVLMVLGMANGPKLSGPFVPFAVAAYIMAWGSMGGPFEGAAMNPARALGPDVALGDLSSYWVYVVGPLVGAAIAVAVAYVLRGPAKAQARMARYWSREATRVSRGSRGWWW